MRPLCSLCKLFIIGVVAVLVSCQGGNNHVKPQTGGDTVKFNYATLLTVVRYADHVHIDIANPWAKGKTLRSYDVVPPLNKVVVTTTAHCQLMDWLGALDQLAGVCDKQYIAVSEVQSRLNNGKTVDCGNSMNPDVERMAAVGANAIIVSPFENSGGYGRLENTGITIIEAADYMEPSPLARAEWMKLYGILFGRERQADSLFHIVDSTYNHLRNEALKLPKGRTLLIERKIGSVWYCPGGKSTIGRLIADAHACYPWMKDKHSGSLPMAPEEVIARGSHAEAWMFVCSGNTMSRTDLAAEYAGYNTLDAYRNGEVYACNTDKSHYFEEIPFRPDYLLRDYIQIAHPGISLGGLRYYKRIE